MVDTVYEISFVPVIGQSAHWSELSASRILNAAFVHAASDLLAQNNTAPARSVSFELSVCKAATIFERQAVRARSVRALPMNEAMLELTFPHVTGNPCHDAISFRETIFELAVESATRKANVSGAM